MQCAKLLTCFLLTSVLAFGSCDFDNDQIADSKDSQVNESGYYPIEYHHMFDLEDCKTPKTTPTPTPPPAPDADPKSELILTGSIVLLTKPHNAR